MADIMDGEIQDQTVAGTQYRRIYLYPDGSNQRAQIMVRNDYAGQPVYALHFFHGKGGDESNFNVARSKTTRDALMDDGNWIVTQSNAQGVNWGNPASILDYEAIIGYAGRTYDVAGSATYGQSMGGITSLLTIRRGLIPRPFAHVGISAWCDLRAAWDHPEDYTGGIRNAYFLGLPKTLANFLQYTVGHDPMLHPAEDWAGIAMMMVASPDDVSTPLANSVNWVDRMAPHVPEASLVTVTGPHLSTAHFPPTTPIMPFLQSHAPVI